jgi:regulator of RNase E activity RraA
LLQLKLVGAEGLVTDGAIRDLGAVSEYGYPLFSGGRTGAVGEPDVWPFEANVTIQCGGVAVVPGDLIVTDDDGVAVVPAAIVNEAIEEFVKALIEKENCSPGKYYPINDDMIARYRREQGS